MTATPFDIDAWQTGQGPSSVDEYSIKDTPFAEYWQELPTLMPSSASSTTLQVDGHSFKGRMAVLKYLICDIESVDLWGINREWHWLWGYASQLDWQHRSGRLAVGQEAGDDTDVISTNSWWNYMNFCFSICILLGAHRSGVLDGVDDIQLDPASQELVANDAAVQKCIASWQHLFETAYRDYVESMKSMTIPSKEVGSARFQLQQQIWIAHTNVILYTIGDDSSNVTGMSPRAAKLLHKLPQPEQHFCLGWCRMVEIIAACTFPTDLVSLKQDGAGFLPRQVVTLACLEKWQSLPVLSSPESRRMHSVEVTHKLLLSSSASLHRMASFWQRVVRTNEISRAMPATIKRLSHGSTPVKLQQLTRLFYLYLRPRGMLEWSIAVATLSAIIATKRAMSNK